MKVRKDFVTNSSSSSFIIEKNQLSYGQLLKYLLQIANKEAEYWEGKSNEKAYKWKDVDRNCVAGRYNITEATSENPYMMYEDDIYTNHYIIDNEEYGRYDWNAIEEVLNKHSIEWKRGYCD